MQKLAFRKLRFFYTVGFAGKRKPGALAHEVVSCDNVARVFTLILTVDRGITPIMLTTTRPNTMCKMSKVVNRAMMAF